MKIFTHIALIGLVVFLFASAPSAFAAGEDGRKTPYFGYSWPFGDTDIAQEIGNTPILLEFFSDQGCMYCPPADQFFNDLIRKNLPVTTLTYHVNALRVVTDNPYATQETYDRHLFYSVILHQMRYTPEIIVNGHKQVKGYMFQEVLTAMKDAAKEQSLALKIIKDKAPDSYHVHLEAVEMGIIEGFDDHIMVKLVEYQTPVKSPVKTGPNEGLDLEYLHVVSSITQLDDWLGEERDYSFKWTPSKNAAGVVLILERQDKGLIAFGEIKRPD